MIRQAMLCLIALPLLLAAEGDTDAAIPLGGVLMDDSTFTIRPLIGSAGHARTGTSSVGSARYALVAPDGHTALVVTETAISVVRRVDTNNPVWRLLTEDRLTVDRAVWSRDADALAIYDAHQSLMQVWKSVQTDPAPAGSIDMSAFPAAPALLALSSDASCLFATFPERDFASLYLLPVGGVGHPLLSLFRPSALLLDGGTLYVADRGRAVVDAISNWDFALNVRTVVAPGNGISDPAGIGLSSDRTQLYVADAGSNQLLAFDLSSSTQKGVVELGFRPTRMEPVGAGSLFLLDKGTPGESPAEILQASNLQVIDVLLANSAAP